MDNFAFINVIRVGIKALLILIVIHILIHAANDKKRRKAEFIQKRRESVGRKGEDDLYNNLRGELLPGEKILRNLYIPLGNGNTTEIDVLVIGGAGIFVYECKAYSGKVDGGKYDDYWTQTYYTKNDKKTRKFYNPLKQNETHVNALRNYLANKGPILPPIRGYVSFPSSCILSDKVLEIDKGFAVVNEYTAADRLGAELYMVYRRTTLDKEQMQELYDFLKKHCVDVSDRVKKKHLNYVKKAQRR